MQCTFGRSCNISNVNNMQEIRIFAQIFNRLLSKKSNALDEQKDMDKIEVAFATLVHMHERYGSPVSEKQMVEERMPFLN